MKKMEKPNPNAFEKLISILQISEDDENIFKTKEPKKKPVENKSAGEKKKKVEEDPVKKFEGSDFLTATEFKIKPLKTPIEMAKMKAEREQKLLKKSKTNIHDVLEKPEKPEDPNAKQHISVESVKITTEQPPKVASRTPSFLLSQGSAPVLPTKFVPKQDKDVKEMKSYFDLKKMLKDRSIKSYKESQLNKTINPPSDKKKTKSGKVKSAKPAMSDEKKFLSLVPKEKLKIDTANLKLGYPVGLQLGSFNIEHESFPKSCRGKQAFETMFVAHGMSFLKPPVKWTDTDINDILFAGTELFNSSDVNEKFDNMNVITKSFLLKSHRLRVSLSEPKVVGRILTTEERSISLYEGLKMYFEVYKCGVLKSPDLDLYIKKGKMFYVFDPRGRTGRCERSVKNGEAAIIALADLENVYHLVLNLSKVNVNAPFKISFIELAKAVENDYDDPVVIEDNAAERQTDYKIINNDVAILNANLSYNSKFFGDSANKQHLATSIMAFVYSKIDPPNSWSRNELDKIVRLGTEFYEDFRNRKNLSLKLTDIPSKFYVGENFKAEIVIIPNIIPEKVFEKTHMYFDSTFCITLKEVFDLQKVTAFLVQVGEATFAVWKAKHCEVYYLFDGYEKDETGEFDPYGGSASILMIATLDNLCRIFFERLLKLNDTIDAVFKIHGLMVIDVERLTPRQQQKKRPRIKCLKNEKTDFARLEDFEKIKEVSSIVQAVELSATKNKQKLMVDRRPDKPLYKKVTDLNSPSLVCEPPKEYDEIIRSLRRKRDELLSQGKATDKISTLNALVESVRSNFLQTIDLDPPPPEPEEKPEDGLKKSDDKSQSEAKDDVEKKSTVLLETVIEEKELTAREEIKSKSKENVKKSLEKLPLSVSIKPLEKIESKAEKPEPAKKPEDGPSHFEKLPDQTEIIHASKSILEMTSSSIHDISNMSLFACISAIMTSAKYSISSWSPEVLDYVLTNAENLVKFANLRNRMDLFTNAELKLTKLKIREKLYNLTLTAIDHNVWPNLMVNVEKNFHKNDRFVISTLRGSVTVFKRSNLYYLFEGFPCNLFGYRSTAGFSSFIRVGDLRTLVRRIKKNHEDNKDGDNFIVHLITFERVSAEDSKKKNDKLVKRENPSVLGKDNVLVKTIEKPKLGTNLLPDITNPKIVKNKEIIRGTFALDNRDEIKENEIKPCHFASAFAIMYTIHHPIEKQNYRSVDIILENGLKIYDSLKEHKLQDHRLKNVIVDDTNYEIQVLKQELGTPVKGIHNREEYFGLKETLKRSFFRQKYVMIQFPNCCYTLVKVDSKTFYLFDSYEVINYEGLFEEFSKKIELEKKSAENKEKEDKTKKDDDPEKKLDGDGKSNAETKPEDDPDKKAEEEKKKKGEKSLELDEKEFQRKFYIFLRSKMTSNKIGSTAGWSRFNKLSKLIDYLETTLNDPLVYTKFTIHNVFILSYDKVKDQNKHTGYMLLDNSQDEISNVRNKDCKRKDEKKLPAESVDWVTKTHVIPWSRLKIKNLSSSVRNTIPAKWKDFDVEIKNSLYSLWAKDHPNMTKFGKSAGKQHSAVCIMSLLMAQCTPIDEWTSRTLDQLVDFGTKYYENSLTLMKDQNEKFDFKHLAPTFTLQDFQFKIKIYSKLAGYFYDHRKEATNFSKALQYIFETTELIGGILKSGDRFVAFGKSGKDYFMFDCQSCDPPLFAHGIGVAYLLRCCCLSTLLKCLILTMGAKTHNVSFEIFGVDVWLNSEKHLKYLEKIESKKTEMEDKKKEEEKTKTEREEEGLKEAEKQAQKMAEEEKEKAKKKEEIKKAKEEAKKKAEEEAKEKAKKEAEEKAEAEKKKKEEKKKENAEKKEKEKAAKEAKEKKKEEDKKKLEEGVNVLKQKEAEKKAEQDTRRSSQQENKQKSADVKIQKALDQANEFLEKTNAAEITQAKEEQEKAKNEMENAKTEKENAEKALKEATDKKTSAEKELELARLEKEKAGQEIKDAIQKREAAEKSEEQAKIDKENADQAEATAKTKIEEAEKEEQKAIVDKAEAENVEKEALSEINAAEEAEKTAPDDDAKEKATIDKSAAQQKLDKAKNDKLIAEQAETNAKMKKSAAQQAITDAIAKRSAGIQAETQAETDKKTALEEETKAQESKQIAEEKENKALKEKEAAEEEEKNAKIRRDAAKQVEEDAKLKTEAALKTEEKAKEEKEAADKEDELLAALDADLFE